MENSVVMSRPLQIIAVPRLADTSQCTILCSFAAAFEGPTFSVEQATSQYPPWSTELLDHGDRRTARTALKVGYIGSANPSLERKLFLPPALLVAKAA
jgi:hypothetical protein